MRELILYIAQGLLDTPDRVEVTERVGDQTTVLELKVASEDLGKIIGRQGRTAKALRTVVNAAALKAGKRVILEIVEKNAGTHH
ncbi:KH domain-containing protein [bacterium]|nr:KH domain-containing protein [candidate division CSSED10-310 bacterium]